MKLNLLVLVLTCFVFGSCASESIQDMLCTNSDEPSLQYLQVINEDCEETLNQLLNFEKKTLLGSEPELAIEFYKSWFKEVGLNKPSPTQVKKIVSEAKKNDYLSFLIAELHLRKVLSFEGTDKQIARFVSASEAGIHLSFSRLGIIYLQGIGVNKNRTKAIFFLKKGADVGLPVASHILALQYYLDGNFNEAYKHFVKAHNEGYISSAFNIGIMYYSGEFVEQDHDLFIQWITKSAERGHIRAQKVLGGELLSSRDTNKVNEGIFWLKKVADIGDLDAKYLLLRNEFLDILKPNGLDKQSAELEVLRLINDLKIIANEEHEASKKLLTQMLNFIEDINGSSKEKSSAGRTKL